MFPFKLIRFDQPFFDATFAVHLLCQVGFVIAWLEILGRKPLWKNGSSSVMSILMNRPLLTTLSSRAPITVTASLEQPGFLNNVILYPVRPRYLATILTFGNEWRHHCPHCGHGPNATSYIRNSSVPFPNAWNCPIRAMISCQATRILSPRDRIALLCGVR